MSTGAMPEAALVALAAWRESEAARVAAREAARSRWVQEDARLTGEILAAERDGQDASALRRERIAVAHECCAAVGMNA